MPNLKSTILVICCSLTLAGRAQENPAPAAAVTAPTAANAPAANANNDGSGQRQRWKNFNPADYQARMMKRLRDHFEVTDDAEWQLISERITKVMELRRSTLGGPMRLRAGGGNGANASQAAPEQDALEAAITDKLPDAEIKARLERLRAAHKLSEAKLDQAREDLRAVLTIRQEAIAVLAGILP